MPDARHAVAPLAVLLAVGLAACGGGGGPSATDVTTSYLQAVSRADGARACDLMTSDFRRVSATSAGAAVRTCEASVAQMARLLGPQGRAAVAKARVTDEGSGAQGSRWVRIRSGPLAGELVTLTKVDGHWLISAQVAPQA